MKIESCNDNMRFTHTPGEHMHHCTNEQGVITKLHWPAGSLCNKSSQVPKHHHQTNLGELCRFQSLGRIWLHHNMYRTLGAQLKTAAQRPPARHLTLCTHPHSYDPSSQFTEVHCLPKSETDLQVHNTIRRCGTFWHTPLAAYWYLGRHPPP